MADPIFVGKSDQDVFLLPKLANRHGLIAGATGTGKTVTLQILAEQFSEMGVPVFMADVKGDLSGISQPGGGKPPIDKRAEDIGLGKLEYKGFPVIFWDLFGAKGHRLRTTVSEMGPLLLARLLDLNETQEGVLNVAFRVADDEGLLLLDLKDLRSMLSFVGEHASELEKDYGRVASASVGAIQRQLLVLEQQRAEDFFGEPALDLRDLMRVNHEGKGIINILAADELMQNPKLYSTFLLWLLAELFEELPEVGDLDQPKLVFFFDEAHLLFNDAPKALVEKVEQVVRLIRSKGVGVYFCTQNPIDVPDTVLGQLGNRFQHALRAFTPRDQKAVRSAADTFRPNPLFKTDEVITTLGVGEALVSTLEGKGTPIVVQQTLIRPPLSRLGPANDQERSSVMAGSPVGAIYDKEVDRDSAYEELTRRAEKAAEEEAKLQAQEEKAKLMEKEQRVTSRSRSRSRRSDSPVEAMLKSTLRSAGTSLGKQIVRGVLGSIFKGR
ncbi:MAG: DUF853 family protein [Armatimonadetes bacterium]|nr:DUF853 family protein [Armatimonadota bacterium]